ncbi:pilus assembly FimT family protein [Ramlibacter sp. MMS24-I3-19]|uniref:pilus assembly FimT family protein n=1 Tax=Ramlibacter sp. MMS24-I3-19 TaxID=3416606 RepID=UPI003CFCF8AB
MPTSVPGSSATAAPSRLRASGFTLIELMVVVAIIAIATAGVSFAIRDSAAAQLDREAQRLSALFESARAQSRTSGVAVVWHPVDGGFRFDGLPDKALPDHWLSSGTYVQGGPAIVLGPEPIIGRQSVVIASTAVPQRSLRIETDGLRPFTVTEPTP